MLNRESRLTFFFLSYDIALIALSFFVSVVVKFGGFDVGHYTVILPVIVFSWLCVKTIYTHENYFFRDTVLQRFKGQFLDFILLSGIVSSVLLVLETRLTSRLIIFGTIFGFFLLRNLGYIVIYQYLKTRRKRGRHVAKLLVLGAGKVGAQLQRHVERDVSLGYKIVGFLDDNRDASNVDSSLILGKLDDLKEILLSTEVDEIVISLPLSANEQILESLDQADFHGVRVKLVPDYYRMFNRNFQITQLGNMPVINLRKIPLDNLFNQLFKRTFDILFSAAVLVCLFPLFLIIGVLIILDSKGPVLYRPVRIGKEGREFRCLKFRTMFKNEDSKHNTKSTVAGDKRITRVGTFLRKKNLDELPQFMNVLIGEMSVVGPRPHRTYLNQHMQKQVEGYMVRHYIKPGITGWAQVNGWRGPTETYEQKSERTTHDIWYIENWSFLLDLEIIYLTLFGKSTNKNAF